MRSLPGTGLLLTVALLCGCAPRPLVLRTPVAPQPWRIGRRAEGFLIVYTAQRVTGYTGSEFPLFGPYRLFGIDGVLIGEVRNQDGPFGADPERLALAAGQYRVRGLAEGGGSVSVPVVIEAGRTTWVDLAQLARLH